MIGNIDIEKFVICLRDIIILIAGLIVLYILLFNDRLAFTIAGSLITISSQWLLAGRGKKQEQKKIATFLISILDNQITRLFRIETELMSVINKNNQMARPYTIEEEQMSVIEKKANLESVKNHCEKCKPEMESDYRLLQNKTEIYALDIAPVIVLYVNHVNQVLNYICFLKPDECGDIEQALITIRSYRIDGYSTVMKLSQEVFINEIIFNKCVSYLKSDYQRLYQLKCNYEKQRFDSYCEHTAMKQIEKLLKDYGQEI